MAYGIRMHLWPYVNVHQLLLALYTGMLLPYPLWSVCDIKGDNSPYTEA